MELKRSELVLYWNDGCSYKGLESAMQYQQRENETIVDAHPLFAGTMVTFWTKEDRLKSNAQIVHCPHFESAVIKIQEKRVAQMRTEGRYAISLLTTGRVER